MVNHINVKQIKATELSGNPTRIPERTRPHHRRGLKKRFILCGAQLVLGSPVSTKLTIHGNGRLWVVAPLSIYPHKPWTSVTDPSS